MIERYNYLGDPNIGFSATVTPEYAVYPPEFKKKGFFDKEVSVETFIGRTRLVGLFTAGNSNCLLVPSNLTDNERSKLEESGINFKVLETRENALGNLILANDEGALVSPRLEEHQEAIEEALDVNTRTGKVAGLPGVGACGATNKYGVLLHREATEEEAEAARDVLQAENVDIGTVNLGSPYIGSGVVGDDENVLVGEDTSGPEVGRIDRTMQKHD